MQENNKKLRVGKLLEKIKRSCEMVLQDIIDQGASFLYALKFKGTGT